MSLKYEASLEPGASAIRRRANPVGLAPGLTLVTGPRRSLSLKLSDTKVYEP